MSELSKNQWDTIVRKSKKYGIIIKKQWHNPYLLTFSQDVYMVDSSMKASNTVKVTGTININPFNFRISFNTNVMYDLLGFNVLHCTLEDLEKFLKWLREYVSTRIK